jgi:hypothetical protein
MNSSTPIRAISALSLSSNPVHSPTHPTVNPTSFFSSDELEATHTLIRLGILKIIKGIHPC